MAMCSPPSLFLVSCFLWVLLAAGCQRSGIDRLPIHGTVQTVAGEKFDASISFQPVGGKRPVANWTVKNGEYRFDRTNGPTAGPTKVFVRRLVGRGGSLPPRMKTVGRDPRNADPRRSSNGRCRRTCGTTESTFRILF